MKRLSPQLVVSVRALGMEETSGRNRGGPQARMGSPEIAPSPIGLTPATPCTHPHAERISVRPSLLSSGSWIDDFSPYFSSSLTLSFRGAVSPARHVLTRPRPHPFSRQREDRTSGPFCAGESRGPARVEDAECAVKVPLNTGTRTITEDGGCDATSRHGRPPWPQLRGIAPREAAAFPIAPHRGNPEDAPGRSVAEHRSQSQRPSGRGFSDLWIA